MARYLFLAATPFAVDATAHAGDIDLLPDRIAAIVRQTSAANQPGCQVAVVWNGKIVATSVHGLANVAKRIPIASDTLFQLGSVTKQVVALAALLLERDGKLSLDDDVRKYVPELPDYGHLITLKHLLQHTSGLRGELTLLAMAGVPLDGTYAGAAVSHRDALAMLCRQKGLNFDPGSAWEYCNSGYTVMSEVVARVSGRSLAEFCRDRIFRPLGMEHSRIVEPSDRLPENLAPSYIRRGDAFAVVDYEGVGAGPAGLVGTASDMAAWLDNFRSGKVGGPDVLRRLCAQPTEKWQKYYGLGVEVGWSRGLRTVGHSGSLAGYQSYVVWFPQHNLGVAIVGNYRIDDVDRLATDIAAAYVSEKMTAAKPATKQPATMALAVPVGTLQRYVGVYASPDLAHPEQFVIEGDQLCWGGVVQPPIPLRALSDKRFSSEQFGCELEFQPQAGDAVTLVVRQNGSVITAEKLNHPLKTEAELQAYAGRYCSADVNTEYELAVREGRLVVRRSAAGAFDLIPVEKDWFASTRWFAQAITFERASSGKITGFKMSGPQVHGVEFARVD